MENRWRGEVVLVVNGQHHRMKLTLGTLAELEEELEEPSLMALVQRFETGGYSTRDVLALLCAGMRGAACRWILTYWPVRTSKVDQCVLPRQRLSCWRVHLWWLREYGL